MSMHTVVAWKSCVAKKKTKNFLIGLEVHSPGGTHVQFMAGKAYALGEIQVFLFWQISVASNLLLNTPSYICRIEQLSTLWT